MIAYSTTVGGKDVTVHVHDSLRHLVMRLDGYDTRMSRVEVADLVTVLALALGDLDDEGTQR